jgi:hypothetical protein
MPESCNNSCGLHALGTPNSVAHLVAFSITVSPHATIFTVPENDCADFEDKPAQSRHSQGCLRKLFVWIQTKDGGVDGTSYYRHGRSAGETMKG